jgi:hypothetical protein
MSLHLFVVDDFRNPARHHRGMMMRFSPALSTGTHDHRTNSTELTLRVEIAMPGFVVVIFSKRTFGNFMNRLDSPNSPPVPVESGNEARAFSVRILFGVTSRSLVGTHSRILNHDSLFVCRPLMAPNHPTGLGSTTKKQSSTRYGTSQ